jgi:hypothetical protein
MNLICLVYTPDIQCLCVRYQGKMYLVYKLNINVYKIGQCIYPKDAQNIVSLQYLLPVCGAGIK